jgi:hypothetical protein
LARVVSGLARHLAAATRLRLPGDYVALTMGGVGVGFLRPETARLLGGGAAVEVGDAAGLLRAQAALVAAGVVRRRGEDFDVRAAWDGPVLGVVDRGALPVLGIEAQGVHVNGLVRDGDGWSLWVARRSRTKLLDAGKLDHLVAGGICAGMDAAGTLVKEAGEEASVPAALARTARWAGMLRYAIARQEGLRRDRLFCYDLEVPADFTPVPRDGEVEGFTLMRLADVLRGVAETDDYKFNVTLVIIDLCARLGMIATPRALQALRR